MKIEYHCESYEGVRLMVFNTTCNITSFI